MRRISVKPKICTHQNVWTAFQITNVRLQKDEKPTKKEKKNSLPQRAERWTETTTQDWRRQWQCCEIQSTCSTSNNQSRVSEPGNIKKRLKKQSSNKRRKDLLFLHVIHDKESQIVRLRHDDVSFLAFLNQPIQSRLIGRLFPPPKMLEKVLQFFSHPKITFAQASDSCSFFGMTRNCPSLVMACFAWLMGASATIGMAATTGTLASGNFDSDALLLLWEMRGSELFCADLRSSALTAKSGFTVLSNSSYERSAPLGDKDSSPRTDRGLLSPPETFVFGGDATSPTARYSTDRACNCSSVKKLGASK